MVSKRGSSAAQGPSLVVRFADAVERDLYFANARGLEEGGHIPRDGYPLVTTADVKVGASMPPRECVRSIFASPRRAAMVLRRILLCIFFVPRIQCRRTGRRQSITSSRNIFAVRVVALLIAIDAGEIAGVGRHEENLDFVCVPAIEPFEIFCS